MKTDIHPDTHRLVIFQDTTSGERFLVPSTVETEETDKWTDGKEYPLYKVEISSASHPFYTGKETVIDTAGRVEKFKSRMAKKSPAKKVAVEAPAAEEKAEPTSTEETPAEEVEPEPAPKDAESTPEAEEKTEESTES